MSVKLNLGSESELSEFLLEQETRDKKPTFFSRETWSKYVPKYSNFENDFAVRFGLTTSESASSGWCNLSRKDRIVGFFVFLGIGVLLLMISSLYIPVLLFKARKFSIIFTLGSLFTFSSLMFLWGAVAFFRHLTAANRLVFTVMYFGSLFSTLFFAMHLQSTILTIIAISFQFLSLLFLIVSHIPGYNMIMAGINPLKFVV